MTTRISIFRCSLMRASQAKPRCMSGWAAHLKNIETNSSGGGTLFEIFFLFKVLEITEEG